MLGWVHQHSMCIRSPLRVDCFVPISSSDLCCIRLMQPTVKPPSAIKQALQPPCQHAHAQKPVITCKGQICKLAYTLQDSIATMLPSFLRVYEAIHVSLLFMDHSIDEVVAEGGYCPCRPFQMAAALAAAQGPSRQYRSAPCCYRRAA